MKLYSNVTGNDKRLTQLYLTPEEANHLGGVGTTVSLDWYADRPYIRGGDRYPYVLKADPNGRSRIVVDRAHVQSGPNPFRVTTNFSDLPRTLRVEVKTLLVTEGQLVFRFKQIRHPDDPDGTATPVSNEQLEGKLETPSAAPAEDRQARAAELSASIRKQAEGFSDRAFGAADRSRIQRFTETMRLVEAMAKRLDAELFIDDDGILRAKVTTII